ncbi:MAG: hypothetical protein WA052_00085 [Microgenomates group bacterium]
MNDYSAKDIKKAKELRLNGRTYGEISRELNKIIPKSTFSYWFRGLVLSSDVQEKLSENIAEKLNIARIKAVKVNKEKRSVFLKSLDQENEPVSRKLKELDTAKIALSMLCLGEASKYGSGAAFYLGSSNPKIIILFVKLLKRCFPIDFSKFRFTVQCRADQDVEELERYWRKVVGVAGGQFYKTRIDPRSSGKPTEKVDYKGVLRVDYLDTKVQLELESLANLLYNQAVSL